MPGSIMENTDAPIAPPTTHIQNAPRLQPRHATLKKNNQNTPITLYPISSGASSLPESLVEFLWREFNAEIERGSTYPMDRTFSLEKFAEYWFGTFAVVVLMGEEEEIKDDGRDWERECLGTFYIKPNYPGRCSHVCNGGFITTTAARGKGVGSVMGETYLEYAPKLGYRYSVFNLVFANNPASIRIWEKLGFNVIGRVPGAAQLANSEEPVDALIFGRELV
ncbi:hypothetical protein DTO169E5_1270 [Paecilomyces variotii]|nr:hypothetical protein DTO169C6_6560 [Paecilomyces variotii]KAJ9244889.1 hypothetical protein DTO169E5_1270 [Paecilomyces variotii]KAJ9303669.1 hypothetical protein DTO217A2_6885 [Paecilomyces variotii]